MKYLHRRALVVILCIGTFSLACGGSPPPSEP